MYAKRPLWTLLGISWTILYHTSPTFPNPSHFWVIVILYDMNVNDKEYFYIDATLSSIFSLSSTSIRKELRLHEVIWWWSASDLWAMPKVMKNASSAIHLRSVDDMDDAIKAAEWLKLKEKVELHHPILQRKEQPVQTQSCTWGTSFSSVMPSVKMEIWQGWRKSKTRDPFKTSHYLSQLCLLEAVNNDTEHCCFACN